MVITVASAELAPVSEPGLLFPPELDIAGSALTIAVVVSQKLVTSERLRLITCVWILICPTQSSGRLSDSLVNCGGARSFSAVYTGVLSQM